MKNHSIAAPMTGGTSTTHCTTARSSSFHSPSSSPPTSRYTCSWKGGWHSYLMGSICSMSKWGKWGTEIFPQLWKFGTKGINKNLLQFVTPLYQGLNFLNLISSCFLRNFLQLTHPIVKTELLSILTKKIVPALHQEWTKKVVLESSTSWLPSWSDEKNCTWLL